MKIISKIIFFAFCFLGLNAEAQNLLPEFKGDLENVEHLIIRSEGNNYMKQAARKVTITIKENQGRTCIFDNINDNDATYFIIMKATKIEELDNNTPHYFLEIKTSGTGEEMIAALFVDDNIICELRVYSKSGDDSKYVESIYNYY